VRAETVVAICALVIAVASLAATVQQARATRLHHRHSVRPLLQVRVGSYDPDRPGEFADLLRTRLKLEIHYESRYGRERFTAVWPPDLDTA
jgi:hypothetical protein